MRNFTLLMLFVAISSFSIAQKVVDIVPFNFQTQDEMVMPSDITDLPQSTNYTEPTGKGGGITIYQETFNTQIPSAWTHYDGGSRNWYWTFSNNLTSSPSTGPYSNTAAPFKTTTGFMVLDADAYNNGTTIALDTYVQTDAIDCSSAASVILSYKQYFRYCCNASTTKLSVFVSNDGSNWTEFSSKKNLQTNTASPNPDIMEIDITSLAAGQPTVYLRFRFYGGSHYFWCIDDIKLRTKYDHDLQLKKAYSTFYSYGYYSQLPTLHRQKINFTSLVYNAGANNEPGVAQNIKVFGPSNNNVYDQTGPTVTLNVAQTDSLLYNSTNNFEMEQYCNNVGLYTTVFTATMPATEDNPSNNTDTLRFRLSDSTIARAYWSTTTSFVDNSGDLVGYRFYTMVPDKANSATIYIAPATTAGTSIQCIIYEYSTITSSWNEKISTDQYTIQTGDKGKSVTLPFLSLGQGDDVLDTTSSFIIACKLFFGGGQTCQLLADNKTIQDYPMVSRVNAAGTWMWTNKVPAIMLNVENKPAGIKNYTNNEASLRIYPNPTKGKLSIDGIENNATVYIYNIVGEVVYNTQLTNYRNNIDITNLEAGTYFVKIVNDSNTAVKKIFLTK